MGNETTFLTIGAGDWLQAGATVVGIIATVALAIGIEQWKRNAPHREIKQRVKEVVVQLAEAVPAAANNIPADSTQFENYQRALEIETGLMTAIEMYRFVRGETRVTDLKLWTALGELDAVIAAQEPLIRRELGLLQDHGNYDQVYQINRNQVSGAAAAIAVKLDLAKPLLGIA